MRQYTVWGTGGASRGCFRRIISTTAIRRLLQRVSHSNASAPHRYGRRCKWSIGSMARSFIEKLCKALRRSIKSSDWLAAVLLAVASFSLIYVVESSPGEARPLFLLQRTTVLAISGSFLASTLFWISHWL